MPTLPSRRCLLTIQGYTWSLYYLEDDHERGGATLWNCGQFGSTETLVGAYQVAAALQTLMYWFEEKILRPRGLCPGELREPTNT